MGVLRHLIEATQSRAATSSARLVSNATPSVGLCVDDVDVDGLAGHRAAWADLCARALEPNVFLDPSFALPLFEHAVAGGAWRCLLVWEENGPTTFGRLVGLFPLALPIRRSGTCRIAKHEQTSSGTPLVDRVRFAEVLETLMTWVSSSRAPHAAAALTIASVHDDGAFAVGLRQFCAASSRPLVVLESQSRAVLHRPHGDEDRVVSFASARRRKQYARQARRLAAKGTRTFSYARSVNDVAAATERFLALEHQSWKGARGTALLAVPALATFARAMTRTMASEGRCRIDAVEVDGRPVAMGIVLIDGDRAHFWKTAYDEAYGLYSPGVQLALDLTQRHLVDPSLSITDSCTDANHPVIDRLWPDHIVISDMMIATKPGTDRAFVRRLVAERARRAIRRTAKALLHRMRRWKRRLKKARPGPILT